MLALTGCTAALLGVFATEPPAEIRVARFGAMPNDGQDDTQAFLDAFREAQETGAKRIVLRPGRYDLTAGANAADANTLFAFHDLDGLTVDGGGAELWVSGATNLFAFTRCRDVTVRNLAVDSPRPPFSVGEVIAAEPRSFDVRVADEFPVVGGEGVSAYMDYDKATRLPAPHGLDVYGSVASTELIAPQTLRLHLDRDILLQVGRLVVLRHLVYGHDAFIFDHCSRVKVEDVTVYSTPGMGVVAIVCEDISLSRFDVRIRPGTQRLMSSTADASHFAGCKGTVSLTDCYYEGMGDDGANVKSGLYLTVLKRVDDHTVLGQHNLKMVDLPDPGDTMELIHADTLIAYASSGVRAASIEPGEGNVHRVTFADALPAELREGDVIGNASRAPRLRMKGCTVARNRARGVLCQTRDAVIEDCTFDHCTSAGVLVMTEVVYFYESIGTRDVTVRGCRFLGCNYGAASAESALQAFAWVKDWAYPPRPGVHHGVTFEDNVIAGTDEAAIFAAGVDGLTIRGNTIERACRDPRRDLGHDAVHVISSSDVVIEGNATDPAAQGQGFGAAVTVAE
jgi:hypothetical protein